MCVSDCQSDREIAEVRQVIVEDLDPLTYRSAQHLLNLYVYN